MFALLLLVLPFQAVWAAASAYCAHETSAAGSKHFGHHEHQHQASHDSVPAPDDAGGAPGTTSFHGDCAACHLGCSAVTPTLVVAAVTAPPGVQSPAAASSYTSYIPAGPERPERLAVATAVRSGGDVSGPGTPI